MGAANSMVMSLVWACVAMVLLVVVVATRMLYVRISEMRRLRIHPQQVATSKLMDKYQSVQASDNYRNLFEMPMLFYLVCALIVALGKADSTFASLAWGYVALRVVHSAIQCSYNKVNHRFLAFVASAVLLVWMWLRLALGLG